MMELVLANNRRARLCIECAKFRKLFLNRKIFVNFFFNFNVRAGLTAGHFLFMSGRNRGVERGDLPLNLIKFKNQ